MEDFLNGRWPQVKMNSMEEHLYGRGSEWKSTSMEALQEANDISLLAGKFCTELGPAQLQLVFAFVRASVW